LPAGLLQGLKVVAVAVVAQAVWGMARVLCPDAARATLAVLAAALVLLLPGPGSQVAAIAGGGLAGLLVLRAGTEAPSGTLGITANRGVAVVALVVFFGLLL